MKVFRSGSESIIEFSEVADYVSVKEKKSHIHNTAVNLYAPHIHSSLEYVCPSTADLIFNP